MDIITGIVICVIAAGLVAIIIFQQYYGYRERIEMGKIQKVKNVQDLNYVFPQEDVEPEVEEVETKPLEAMSIEDLVERE